MPKKITWEWLRDRLGALNVTWLEREAGLKSKRITDVKRGKSTLTEDELERVRNALNLFR